MKNDFMSDVRKNLKERFGKNKTETQKEKFFSNSAKGFVDFENIKKLHTEAKIPRPLMIDEVAAAWVASLKVSLWQTLGEDFGGYKTGRLIAYILGMLNERIEESTAATIKVDFPLYEQCPIINSNDFRVATTEELLKKSKEILDTIAEKLKESDREGK